MSDRDEGSFAWTPDNTSVILSVSRPGRQFDIYKQDIDAQVPQPLIEKGRSRNHVGIISFAGKPPQDVIARDATFLNSIDRVPDGSGWLSMNATADRTELIYTTRDGRSRVLCAPEPMQVVSAIPSRNGRRLAINTITTTGIWLDVLCSGRKSIYWCTSSNTSRSAGREALADERVILQELESMDDEEPRRDHNRA
jgi:hypothetical protein